MNRFQAHEKSQERLSLGHLILTPKSRWIFVD